MVIYIGDNGLVPFTAVGELVGYDSDTTALVYWDKSYFTTVPCHDLALG